MAAEHPTHATVGQQADRRIAEEVAQQLDLGCDALVVGLLELRRRVVERADPLAPFGQTSRGHTCAIVNGNAAVGQQRDLVFVSYSHERIESRERLLSFLKPWVKHGLVVWADTYIQTGSLWRREIQAAMDRARVGVLLVSHELLASDFIIEVELPALLEAADRGEVRLVCIPISAVPLDVTPLPGGRLPEFQWPRPFDRPLDQLDEPQQYQAWSEICRALVAVAGLEVERSAVSAQPERVRTADPLTASSAAGVLGELHGVPGEKPNYVERPAELARIKTSLLSDGHAAVGITGTRPALGLHGRGGIGKTVLATALAHDREIRGVFPDGVYWLSVGQRPDLVALQTDLARALGDTEVVIADVRRGIQALRTLWGERTALLVLDDVWSLDHVGVLDVANSRSRVVVTTRDGELLTAIGAHEVSIDLLDEDAAQLLLARWAGTEQTALPAAAADVAAAAGLVPLALSVAGALVHDGVPWADVLNALRAGKVTFLDHPSGNVFTSMRLSVDVLPDDVRARYLELAVFPEDTDIPESTIEQLWSRTGDLAGYETRRVLQRLARKGLLYVEPGEGDEATVSFHDLQHDFLRMVARDLAGLHGQLVDTFLAGAATAAGGGG